MYSLYFRNIINYLHVLILKLEMSSLKLEPNKYKLDSKRKKQSLINFNLNKISIEESEVADIYSKEKRSEIMSKIRAKNTKPEISVRKSLHRLGFKRYTLHKRELPGSPDIVFVSRKKAILIHGCFWHHHSNCKLAYTPKTNIKFWLKKIKDNIERDRVCQKRLQGMGYNQLIIWECESKKPEVVEAKLKKFLRK